MCWAECEGAAAVEPPKPRSRPLGRGAQRKGPFAGCGHAAHHPAGGWEHHQCCLFNLSSPCSQNQTVKEQEDAEAQGQVAPAVCSSPLQNLQPQSALMQQHTSKASCRWGTPEALWGGLRLSTAQDPHARGALGWSRLGFETVFGFGLG